MGNNVEKSKIGNLFRSWCLIIKEIKEGIALYRNCEYERALQKFIEATKSNPTSSNAFKWKANCLRRLERYDAALEACQVSLSLDSKNDNTYDVQASIF